MYSLCIKQRGRKKREEEEIGQGVEGGSTREVLCMSVSVGGRTMLFFLIEAELCWGGVIVM